MHQNDWPKAIEYLEKCTNLQPRNADVLFYLAQAYYLNHELVQAQESIRSATQLAPKDAAVLQKAGEYLCEGNDCGPGLDDLARDGDDEPIKNHKNTVRRNDRRRRFGGQLGLIVV